MRVTSYRELPGLGRALGGTVVRWTDALAWGLTGLVLFALSIVFNGCGLVHFEWEGYIGYHLGPGSIWEKIFDSRNLDQNTYTARELSYLVDHLDVWGVALSVHWGWPVFVSLSHGVLGVLLGVWIAWFAARDLRLGSLVGLLLALLFWTGPAFYLHYLGRSAKMLTAVGLAILMTEIHRALRERERLRGRFVILIGSAAVLLAFADRQGFYFLLCACGIMAIQWGFDRTRRTGLILGLLLLVVGIEVVYFFKIAPALTRTFFSYDPDFSLNQLPWDQLRAKPGFFAWRALGLLGSTVGVALGDIPAFAVGGVLLLVAILAWRRDIRFREWRGGIPVGALVVAVPVALWAMYALMILRHPPLLWPDMGLVYYWIPTTALTILGLAWGGSWIESAVGRLGLALALLAGVGGNLCHLPGHAKVVANGHLADSFRRTIEIREALLHRGEPDHLVPAAIALIPAYRALLEFAPKRSFPPVAWAEPRYGAFYLVSRGLAAPLFFANRFGGNVDSRFLTVTAGDFFRLHDGREFIGSSEGRFDLRLNLPANRVRGEAVVQRGSANLTEALFANFVIYACHPSGERYERWRARVELPPGEREVITPYAIDGSHLPSLYSVEIPATAAGKMAAGWRSPQITDVGADSFRPAWLVSSPSEPALRLDEGALAALFPAGWKPGEVWMHGGRVTAGGLELNPGGEIWIKAQNIATRLSGTAESAPSTDGRHPAAIKSFWYKAGRLEGYAPPSPPDPANGRMSFQAWCAEPGGWIVILAVPDPLASPVTVRVNEAGRAN